MLILFLFICLMPSGESWNEAEAQGDSASAALSCEAMLNKALSLNESFKGAVSAGGRRAFELEAEKYFHTVLTEKISGCVAYASAHSDASLSRLIFELAYSYSNTAGEGIPRELARFYSGNQGMTKTILLNYEQSKRHELIEILKWGLDSLYGDKPDDASRLKSLKQSLNELESK